MQDIRQKFTSIKEQVEKRVFDPYLLEYIDTPIIDEDKLLILISIMDCLKVSTSEIENYALSVMLVQIALDTHEHISNSSIDEKNRQLTVLAGDYFSGLYYKFLADSEDILMIKALSRGIKEVNEHKISVYQGEIHEIEDLMTSLKLIESSLLVNISTYFKADLWNDFLVNLLFYKRLLHEKKRYLHAEDTVLFEALNKIMFPDNDYLTETTNEQQDYLIKICDQYLERSKSAVEEGLAQLPCLNNLLEKRVIFLLKQSQPFAKTFVEEG